jgi:NhaA family Na+:H+ antiporter
LNIFLRIVKNETFSAYLLIPVALIAIALGTHFDSHFLEATHHIGNWHFTIREFTLDYLLGFFFYNIGLQLRFELADGALRDRRVLVVSAIAAGLGMFVPAISFYLFNRVNGTPTTGWGITMATDLPFVLAALVLFKKNNLRGFVLALATIDDIGSVIVLSILYKVHLHLAYLLLTLAILALYFAASYLLTSRPLLIALFVVGLAVGHQTGIQTSLIAVLFGIFTFNNQKKGMALHEKLLEVVEPFSAFAIIPIFVFVSLFRRFDFSWHAESSTLVLSLIIVRLIGKPLGIFLGIVLGKLALRVSMIFSLSEALLIGALGTLGLDVSLIFAQRDFIGVQENLAILGILLTIPAGILLSLAVHFLSPRHKTL